MNSNHYYAISALFNGLFSLFVVYYIFLRNKKNPLNRSFMYFGVSVSGWSLIYSLWSFADNAQFAERCVRTHMMFEAFIPATVFHFAVNYTQNFQKYKKTLILSYLLAGIYSLGMQTSWMISGVKKTINFEFWPTPGPFLISHVIYFTFLILGMLFLFAQRIFQSSGKERQQSIWLFSALLIGFGGGSINWFLWFDIPIPPTTNFFVGVMFAMTAYAMVRHGLMDVDSMVEVLRSSRTATLGLLASSLNHELRNPLYIAKGRIESHLDAVSRGIYEKPEREIEKSREIFQSAVNQLDRAMDIVQRFSNFARPYKMNEAAQDVVIAELVNEVLSFAAHELEFQKIHIAERPLNGLVLRANKRQMEEVLFNLIHNAAYAMVEGGALKIRAREHDDKIVIEVLDDGCGISEENQRRIFDPFFSTKADKGTGLGLYITKQLVERNGGKIFVKSKIGKGTCFSLEFKR